MKFKNKKQNKNKKGPASKTNKSSNEKSYCI